MTDTTDIEKKSLEAHVELCAQRYKYLEEKLDSLEQTLGTAVSSITTVKTMVENMSNKNTDRIISWGVGIISFLVATCGYLIATYVFK